MAWQAVLVLVYGIINVLGGVMGFVMSQSTMSLIAGGVSGALLIATAVSAKKHPSMAYRIAGVLTLALLAFWVYRITQVENPMMPMGNAGLAVVVFVSLAISHIVAVSKRKREQSS